MSIWALSDLHLSFSVPEKNMEVFGPLWEGYVNKIETNWKRCVKDDDLILIPGDICWATKLEEAVIDLAWIDALAGTKVLLKGNHDYWWSSKKKLLEMLPPSMHIIQNDAYLWNNIAIGGARLWDTEEFSFNDYIHFQGPPGEKAMLDNEKIYRRELERLKMSLKQLNPSAKWRIALTHFPPVSADLNPSRASKILEEYNIDVCIFGHLHNLKTEKPLFGEARGIKYILTSGDYLDFKPLKIAVKN